MQAKTVSCSHSTMGKGDKDEINLIKSLKCTKKKKKDLKANIKDKHCGKKNINSLHVLFLF